MSVEIPASFFECYAWLSDRFDAVNGFDFYRFLFPDNENAGEYHDDFSHPNAIYLYQGDDAASEDRRLRRRIMLNDTWEADYLEYVEANPMTLCSGLTYRRRSNRIENAQNMNAMIFDLDGVRLAELRSIFDRMEASHEIVRSIPKPTFLVLSGRGIHLYYVFDEPIALYPNIKIQLKALKHDLTFRIWEYKGTSTVESIQYQGIGQSFRMVGSINSKYGNTVSAFRIGDRVSLDYLNLYARMPENRVDLARPFRPSKVSRKMAAELYPEWYQRVVVEKKRNAKKWDIAGKVHGSNPYALYDWWRGHVHQIKGGHRYYFLLCMVIYACKCDVPLGKLKEDMQACFEVLRTFDHENELTQFDVDSALECYSKDYYNFTIHDIELLADVRIERNKRNFQKQYEHLEEARAIRDIRMRRRGEEWDSKNGRKPLFSIVQQWRALHPDGRKSECIRDTGLSKPTVYKWWDYEA